MVTQCFGVCLRIKTIPVPNYKVINRLTISMVRDELIEKIVILPIKSTSHVAPKQHLNMGDFSLSEHFQVPDVLPDVMLEP